MSREIKFRAWDNAEKKWTLNIMEYVSSSRGDIWLEPALKNHEVVLEQYTGLKDKNGKELFDGDVVKYLDAYCHLVIAKVKWFERFNMDDEGEPSIIAGFMLYDGTIVDVSNGELNKAIDELKDSFEIIGNIHENPELLGGEE